MGPRQDENGEWRRLHNEELHSLYRLPNIVRVVKSRRLRWTGHVARMGRSVFKMLADKSTRNSPLRKPRRRWEDNIIMALKEMGIYTRNWVDSALLESPCKCSIAHPGSISHGVSFPT